MSQTLIILGYAPSSKSIGYHFQCTIESSTLKKEAANAADASNQAISRKQHERRTWNIIPAHAIAAGSSKFSTRLSQNCSKFSFALVIKPTTAFHFKLQSPFSTSTLQLFATFTYKIRYNLSYPMLS